MSRRSNSFLKRQKEQRRIERANAKRAQRLERRKRRAERAATGPVEDSESERISSPPPAADQQPEAPSDE
jgi:hypothetical protein